jgi:hypothetical protein
MILSMPRANTKTVTVLLSNYDAGIQGTPEERRIAQNRVFDILILREQSDPDNYVLTEEDKDRVRKLYDQLGLLD